MIYAKYWGLPLVLALGIYCLPSHAQEKRSFSPTDSELMMLPPYCHAKLKGDDSTKRQWASQMGAGIFVHLHHYCFGLNFMNRTMRAMDGKEKAFYATRAVTNFDYVIQRWPPSYPLTMEAKKYKEQMKSLRR
jgi:hypothetical protein